MISVPSNYRSSNDFVRAWVACSQGREVPAPTQTSSIPEEVLKRVCRLICYVNHNLALAADSPIAFSNSCFASLGTTKWHFLEELKTLLSCGQHLDGSVFDEGFDLMFGIPSAASRQRVNPCTTGLPVSELAYSMRPASDYAILDPSVVDHIARASQNLVEVYSLQLYIRKPFFLMQKLYERCSDSSGKERLDRMRDLLRVETLTGDYWTAAPIFGVNPWRTMALWGNTSTSVSRISCFTGTPGFCREMVGPVARCMALSFLNYAFSDVSWAFSSVASDITKNLYRIPNP